MADNPEKPWWAPDAQGFVIGAVVFYVGVVLFYRMTHPVEINDKLLDMMLTILFGTAFVGVINYLVGSSRGSAAKDETAAKVTETLAGKVGTGNGQQDLVTAAAEKAAPPAAEKAAPPVVNTVVPPAVEKAVDAAFKRERTK